jgi:transcriptional regulator with XRE-family HTH domain
LTLGQRIKERRQALGITQQQLSLLSKITLQHISAIEQDKRTPSLPLLVKLSDNLYASLDYLVFGKEGNIDIISAVKANKELDAQQKTSLINLIGVMRANKNEGR